MSTTSVQIASQGLTLCRANAISSFDEGTSEADISKTMYETFVEDILSRYPWTFALKKRRLNRDSTDPVNEYKYRYIVPAEVLHIFSVFNSDNVGAPKIQAYDIIGKYIYTNEEYIYLEYTYRIAETNWPGYFKQFAIYAFASLVCLPVTDNRTLANDLHETAYGTPSEGEQGGKFRVASGIDSRQKPPEEIQNLELVNARF